MEKDATIARLISRVADIEKANREQMAEKDATIDKMAARMAELEAVVAKLGASDAYHNGPNSP